MTNTNILNEVNTMRRQMGLPMLNEAELLEFELNQINLSPLNEGWWENAKYALSKLGKYKAGGKILGKTQATAVANNKINIINCNSIIFLCSNIVCCLCYCSSKCDDTIASI